MVEIDKKSYEGELKVIGAGFGRTGTASLKAALEKLYNGPCYHMHEVISNDLVHCWNPLGGEKNIIFRQIFKGYSATVDFPACSYWKEISEEFPNAKIILSVRDSPEIWFESCKDTIFTVMSFSQFCNIFTYISLKTIPFWFKFDLMCKTTIDKLFHSDYSKENSIKVYNEWIENVKKTAPEGKLLVFNVKEGYQPLCKFLGLPEPNEPFPKTNDKAEFRKGIYALTIAGFLISAGAVGLSAVGIKLAISFFKK